MTRSSKHSLKTCVQLFMPVLSMIPASCGSFSREPVAYTEPLPTVRLDMTAYMNAPEAVSLLGRPLHRLELAPQLRDRRELELDFARAAFERSPNDEESIVWLGRRLAYLGRYRQAIDVYTRGLNVHRHSYKLLRHRGHRYISVREFDRAVDDLQRAANLIESIPDEIEPDGLPNARNLPRSTSHTNIFYHLGLSQYLLGNFGAAAESYKACVEFADNDDMRVAAMYWQYLSLRRLARTDEAAAVLDGILPDMDIIENDSYHRLLLLFRGELDVQDLQPSGGEDDAIDAATVGYGVGMWMRFNGEEELAFKMFRGIIESTNWAAFGHIAAEAELAHEESKQEFTPADDLQSAPAASLNK